MCSASLRRRGSSEACASERQVAERQGRPETRVSVGESVDEVVDQVEREVGLLSPDLRAIVEVEVLARDWDRAGRPAGKLPAGTLVNASGGRNNVKSALLSLTREPHGSQQAEEHPSWDIHCNGHAGHWRILAYRARHL